MKQWLWMFQSLDYSNLCKLSYDLVILLDDLVWGIWKKAECYFFGYISYILVFSYPWTLIHKNLESFLFLGEFKWKGKNHFFS